MTVPASRQINNELDVGRKIPTTAMAEKVLTAQEGVIVESLTGPGIGATVELSHPAWPGDLPALILTHNPATGALGVPNVALPTTHYTFLESNPNGKAELTGVVDLSTLTLVVFYSPYQPEATIGGQSSVVPTDI